MKGEILKYIEENIMLSSNLLNDVKILKDIENVVNIIYECFKKQNKVIFMGNGGSASDASHLVAELVGKLDKERRPLQAVSLSCNEAIITALGNDYGYENIYARQIEAIVKPGDVVVGMSTSGESRNVFLGFKSARSMNAITIALLGKDGGNCMEMCHIPIVINSFNTQRIQEIHMLIGHIICNMIEKKICCEGGV